jgi:CheY-like chemotaxis protein
MTTLLKDWLAHVWTPPLRLPERDEMGILVVDDEVSMCLYADRILRRAGYQGVVASSGPEAVQKAEAMNQVDVLVTDLMMPGMNGDELARHLRQRDPELKVLYVTGFADRLFAERVQLRDGDAFLEKPYSVAALEQAFSLLAYGRLSGIPRASARAATPALWV